MVNKIIRAEEQITNVWVNCKGKAGRKEKSINSLQQQRERLDGMLTGRREGGKFQLSAKRRASEV